VTRPTTIYTIGHSTRSIEEFLAILRAHGVERVADVRTIPRSRHNPQFGADRLSESLREAGIEYTPMPRLGGLRRPRPDSANTGWHHPAFRGYADYMETAAFAEALEELARLAAAKRTVVMCAEAVPWRCHRSLLADALTVRGIAVVDLFDERKAEPHRLTPIARVEDGRLGYPSDQPPLKPVVSRRRVKIRPVRPRP
jgi:uncharacterized protein (DUF488 family)